VRERAPGRARPDVDEQEIQPSGISQRSEFGLSVVGLHRRRPLWQSARGIGPKIAPLILAITGLGMVSAAVVGQMQRSGVSAAAIARFYRSLVGIGHRLIATSRAGMADRERYMCSWCCPFLLRRSLQGARSRRGYA